MVMGWHASHLQANLVKTMSLGNAKLYSQALAEFRTLYTSEVVERVRNQGIAITHDYKNQPAAIPLPATLSMELGKRIGVQMVRVLKTTDSAEAINEAAKLRAELGHGARTQFQYVSR